MIGQKLGGRYELVAKIGGGGMALVYRAHDNVLNRPVAVKVLRPQFATDEDFLRRFRREAQAAASLSHQNIVSIYDVGNDGDTHYIVMELIDGRTLKERIQEGKPLPVVEALDIAYQICEALEHAHQNRIIHRDIKPHNIMLTRNSKVKVTDFGIARAMTSATLTHTGTIIGSVHYFSPEQARGGLTGAKSDLYSLGVVLYEMLTGTLPFQGESAVTIALKHMHERVVPPRSLNLTIPLDVDRLVMRALEKNQLERYASAGDMMADIGRCLAKVRAPAGAQIAPDPPGPSPLPPRRVEKSPPRATEARARTRSEPAPARPTEDEDEEEWPVARRKTRPWVAVLLVLLVLSALGAAGAYLVWDWLNVPTLEVPDVTGMVYLQAQHVLRDRGLTAEQVANRYDDQVPANYVIEQIPEPGTLVRKGRSVKLVVSLGLPLAVVPDLRGVNERDANVRLISSGLALGNITYEYHPEIPEGAIISQSLPSGTRVGTGTLVDVRVSLGPEARVVVVPDFRGQQVNEVLQRLAGLHLQEGEVHQEYSDQPLGVVTRQLPEPGDEVLEGTEVELWYSKGPVTPPNQKTIRFLVPTDRDNDTAVVVEWILYDTGGASVIYKGVHMGGQEVTRTVRWYGAQALLQIKVGDRVWSEQILTTTP